MPAKTTGRASCHGRSVSLASDRDHHRPRHGRRGSPRPGGRMASVGSARKDGALLPAWPRGSFYTGLRLTASRSSCSKNQYCNETESWSRAAAYVERQAVRASANHCRSAGLLLRCSSGPGPPLAAATSRSTASTEPVQQADWRRAGDSPGGEAAVGPQRGARRATPVTAQPGAARNEATDCLQRLAPSGRAGLGQASRSGSARRADPLSGVVLVPRLLGRGPSATTRTSPG